MDVIIHWGVFRHLHDDVNAKAWVLLSAIGLDVIVLSAFLYTKGSSDPMIIMIAFLGIAAVFVFEKFYLRHRSAEETGSAHLRRWSIGSKTTVTGRKKYR